MLHVIHSFHLLTLSSVITGEISVMTEGDEVNKLFIIRPFL